MIRFSPDMDVEPKIGKTPKMDGENNGLNPIKMDDVGGKPTILGNTHISFCGVVRILSKQNSTIFYM